MWNPCVAWWEKIDREHAYLFSGDEWIDFFLGFQKATGFSPWFHNDRFIVYRKIGTDYYMTIDTETSWVCMYHNNEKINLENELVKKGLTKLGIRGFN